MSTRLKREAGRPSRRRGWFITAVCACVLSFQTGAQTAPDDYWLGNARGPHETGMSEEVWTDATRDEILTRDPNDHRKLVIRMWYPAAFQPGAATAPYASGIERYGGFARIDLEAVSARGTRSVLDAEIEHGAERFPVIIFNHGGGWPEFSSTFLTEFLASHAYVVVGIGHTGTNGLERFPDGTAFAIDVQQPRLTDEQRATMTPLEMFLAEGEDPAVQRFNATLVEDVSFVLDTLAKRADTRGDRFFDRLDLARVGCVGWSMGGATCVQATADDGRIRAAVNFDGWLRNASVEATGARVPLLLVEGTDEIGGTLNPDDVDPGFQEMVAEIERRIWRMLRLTAADWYRATLQKADHMHFSDDYLASPAPPSLIAPQRAHEILRSLTLEFFDRYLKGRESPILSRNVAVPELRLRSEPPPAALPAVPP